jgi:hypothetical protein
MPEKPTVKIEIAHRPWYAWLAWAAWLLAVIFIFQNAVASGREYETSASVIFWATELILLIGGVIVWHLRQGRPIQ